MDSVVSRQVTPTDGKDLNTLSGAVTIKMHRRVLRV